MTAFSNTPDLFNAAGAAIRASDFHCAAALCDAASLREFHRGLCVQFGPRPGDFVLTVEKYQQMHPDMPAGVMAYHVERHERERRDPTSTSALPTPTWQHESRLLDRAND